MEYAYIGALVLFAVIMLFQLVRNTWMSERIKDCHRVIEAYHNGEVAADEILREYCRHYGQVMETGGRIRAHEKGHAR